MRVLRSWAAFCFGILMLNCAGLRARDLLPPSGRYQLRIMRADGTPLVATQDFLVVREKGIAAVVYLRTTDGVPPLCLANADRQACENVLGGLHLAKAYVVDDRGLSALESEVVIADPLQIGTKWVSVESAGCQLVREMIAFDENGLVVDVTSKCPGSADEKKFVERWKPGLGLHEIVTADGLKTTISAATPP